MSGIGDALSELKSLPDDALQRELASPTGMLPPYLVLGEMHERKTLRAGNKPPSASRPKSLADEYIGDVRRYLPTMPPSSPGGMPAMPPPAPGGGGISSLNPTPPMKGYARGGIVDLQSYPANQSYPVGPDAMTRYPMVQDPDWDWVRRSMIGSRMRRQNIPFPDEAPIPPSRPLDEGMSYEDLLYLSDPERGEYANGGIVGLASGGQISEIEQYIRASAQRLGIDPDIAVRVAKSEGGVNDLTRQAEARLSYGREESYGPFQLHIRNGGLGARALEAGIDPRKPEDAYKGIDFALAEAKNKGWGQWYGAAKAGIGKWTGIKGHGGASYPSGSSEGYAPTDTADASMSAADAGTTQAATETMAAAEPATTGSLGGIGDYMILSQMFGLNQKPVAAPPPSAPQQPVKPFNPQEFLQDPEFFRRRYG